MFFNLHYKITILDFQFTIIITVMIRDDARGVMVVSHPHPHSPLGISANFIGDPAMEKKFKKKGKKHKNNKKTCTTVESKNSFPVRLYHNHTYPQEKFRRNTVKRHLCYFQGRGVQKYIFCYWHEDSTVGALLQVSKKMVKIICPLELMYFL